MIETRRLKNVIFISTVLRFVLLRRIINWWYYWNKKYEIKKTEDRFFRALLAPLTTLLVQTVISSVVKGINGRGVTRAGRGYMDQNFIFTLSF